MLLCRVMMTVQTLEHGARTDRWDAFVAAHPRGHFLQSSAWARLRVGQGWEALRVEVSDDGAAGDGLIAGAQILLSRTTGGSVAYVPRGPVCDPGGPGWDAVLAGMRETVSGSVVALRLEPHWLDDDDARGALRDAGLREAEPMQPASTLRIDLTTDEDQLLADMKQKWRYNVRLAARRGVTVSEGGLEELAEFERMMSVTADRDGFASRAPGYYSAAWQALGDAAHLYLAGYDGETLGGVFVVRCGHTATYLYGASSDVERQRMPNHLLQWEAMRRARAAGCRWYDLWGVPDELGEAAVRGVDPADVPTGSGGLWGVWGFKRGFGGQVVRYVGAWDDVYRPVRYFAGTSLLPRLRELVRRD